MSAINGSDGSSLLHYLENPQEYFNKLLSYTTGFLLKERNYICYANNHTDKHSIFQMQYFHTNKANYANNQ